VGTQASVLGASWQRCRTHFARNLLTRVPKAAQGFVAAAVRSIFEQADAGEVRAQHDRVVEQMRERFPDAAKLLEEARDDVLAFAAFPRARWRRIWSNNPLERLNKGSEGAPMSSASFPIAAPWFTRFPRTAPRSPRWMYESEAHS
jgi:transposase-like protein